MYPCRAPADALIVHSCPLPTPGFIDTKLPPQGGVNTHDKDVSFPLCQPEGAYKPEVIETRSHNANRDMTEDVLAPDDQCMSAIESEAIISKWKQAAVKQERGSKHLMRGEKTVRDLCSLSFQGT